MKQAIGICLLLLAVGWTVIAAGKAGAMGQGNLWIEAFGFQHTKGQAAAYLYRKSDKLPGKVPFRKAYGAIRDGRGEMRFDGLTYGEYAVIVFHDENNNGEPDHNLFRIPLEPLGFSNQFRPSLLNGLPNFEKLRIIFSAEETRQVVTVR